MLAMEPYRPDSEEDRALAARREAETTGVCCEALSTGVFQYPDRPPHEIPGLVEMARVNRLSQKLRAKLN